VWVKNLNDSMRLNVHADQRQWLNEQHELCRLALANLETQDWVQRTEDTGDSFVTTTVVLESLRESK